mgnify:CR=1 FL=1
MKYLIDFLKAFLKGTIKLFFRLQKWIMRLLKSSKSINVITKLNFRFKADMLYIKKYISNFESVEISSFKDKIDAINKAVLPSKMLVKKKKKENK